jgi:hypothetical protein
VATGARRVGRYEGVDVARTNEVVGKVNETLVPQLRELPGFGGYYPRALHFEWRGYILSGARYILSGRWLRTRFGICVF